MSLSIPSSFSMNGVLIFLQQKKITMQKNIPVISPFALTISRLGLVARDSRKKYANGYK